MKSKPLLTQEIGSIKKPLWALKSLRDKKADNQEKRITRDDLALLNIKQFEEAGLDIVYDGEARRVEMYEYPIRNTSGLLFSGRVRSWDNKYYRKARCVDKVRYKNDYHLNEFLFVKDHASGEVKVPITGPYTLADWSYNEYYPSREDFIIDMARQVIRPLVKDLARHGATRIQVDEPAATTHPKEMDVFVEAFNEAVAGVNSKVSVHICYSGDNYSSLFPHVLDMKVTQFTLEFANRDSWSKGSSKSSRPGYEALQLFGEYGDTREVGLGVIDVHKDELETPELIRDRIIYASKILGDPSRIYVNPDCGLRTRSREVTFSKLANLVEGTKLARKALEINA